MIKITVDDIEYHIINNNEVKVLPETQFTNNHKNIIPKEVKNECGNIKKVSICSQPLNEINDDICNLELDTLTFTHNKIKIINDKISLSKSLKELDMAYNNISVISKQFSQLNNLQILNLSHNDLHYFPLCLTEMTFLAELHINNNPIKILPNEINNMSGLSKLNINSCDLSDIDAVFSLTKLEYLDASYNMISRLYKFPQTLFEYTYIKLNDKISLYIANTIGNLQNLKILKLDHNMIEMIPDEIIHLNRLTYLWLGDNPIKKITESILYIKSLNFLGLHNINKEYIHNELIDDYNDICTCFDIYTKHGSRIFKDVYEETKQFLISKLMPFCTQYLNIQVLINKLDKITIDKLNYKLFDNLTDKDFDIISNINIYDAYTKNKKMNEPYRYITTIVYKIIEKLKNKKFISIVILACIKYNFYESCSEADRTIRIMAILSKVTSSLSALSVSSSVLPCFIISDCIEMH